MKLQRDMYEFSTQNSRTGSVTKERNPRGKPSPRYRITFLFWEEAQHFTSKQKKNPKCGARLRLACCRIPPPPPTEKKKTLKIKKRKETDSSVLLVIFKEPRGVGGFWTISSRRRMGFRRPAGAVTRRRRVLPVLPRFRCFGVCFFGFFGGVFVPHWFIQIWLQQKNKDTRKVQGSLFALFFFPFLCLSLRVDVLGRQIFAWLSCSFFSGNSLALVSDRVLDDFSVNGTVSGRIVDQELSSSKK